MTNVEKATRDIVRAVRKTTVEHSLDYDAQVRAITYSLVSLNEQQRQKHLDKIGTGSHPLKVVETEYISPECI